MKFWYIGAASVLALAALAVMLLHRPRSAPDPQIDGGVRIRTDTNAPKVIASTEIISFNCTFSTYDIMHGDSLIAGYKITLQAGNDRGSYCLYRGSECCEEGIFIPGKAFFEQLQQLVGDYDMARHNGTYYTVSGLPPDYGMELEVSYASGESIRASNNQSCFLPLAAMEALVALFQQQ